LRCEADVIALRAFAARVFAHEPEVIRHAGRQWRPPTTVTVVVLEDTGGFRRAASRVACRIHHEDEFRRFNRIECSSVSHQK
jgi:hypothetical protein